MTVPSSYEMPSRRSSPLSPPAAFATSSHALDHGRDSLFRFVGRKHGDADADSFQRRPENLVRWAVGKPIEKRR
jgi:hypothetical protein